MAKGRIRAGQLLWPMTWFFTSSLHLNRGPRFKKHQGRIIQEAGRNLWRSLIGIDRTADHESIGEPPRVPRYRHKRPSELDSPLYACYSAPGCSERSNLGGTSLTESCEGITMPFGARYAAMIDSSRSHISASLTWMFATIDGYRYLAALAKMSRGSTRIQGCFAQSSQLKCLCI